MNFKKEINRLGTNSVKWDLMAIEGKPEGTIPMWVADMDFEAPKEVKKALKKIVSHNVYGYSFQPDTYYAAVTSWFKKRYDFEFAKEHIITTPGIVTAVGAAVRAFTETSLEII